MGQYNAFRFGDACRPLDPLFMQQTFILKQTMKELKLRTFQLVQGVKSKPAPSKLISVFFSFVCRITVCGA